MHGRLQSQGWQEQLIIKVITNMPISKNATFLLSRTKVIIIFMISSSIMRDVTIIPNIIKFSSCNLFHGLSQQHITIIPTLMKNTCMISNTKSGHACPLQNGIISIINPLVFPHKLTLSATSLHMLQHPSLMQQTTKKNHNIVSKSDSIVSIYTHTIKQ